MTLTDPAPICRPEHRRLIMAAAVLAAAVLASSMGFIDSSVTAIALPAMRASLGGTLAQAQWVSGAYLLTLSALILVGGATSDRFGLVRVFAGGIVLFVLSSARCAVAQSMVQMNLARGLQGVGAAIRAVVGFGLALVVAGLIAVALMGRVARWSYGPVSDAMPGFGLPGSGAAHIAAISAVLALASALTAALMGWR